MGNNDFACTPFMRSIPVGVNIYNAVPQTLPNGQGRSIFSIFPHSHKICDSLGIYAQNGNNVNSRIWLINIRRWDFHFQGFYTYKQMVRVPGGYTLHSYHRYNNNTGNPVCVGYRTQDEMLFDGFMWLDYQNGDETIDIAAQLVGDTLLTCPRPPFSQFTVNNDTICQQSCVNFTDMSNNSPTSWSWSFPGATPSSSTQQNPQNICYTSPGTYTVTLIARNASGCNWGCGCIAATKTIFVDVCTGTGETENQPVISSSAFPNPFGQQITIRYTLKSPALVSTEIFNVYGSKVKTLLVKDETAGTHQAEWDGTNESGAKIPPGVYLYSIRSGNKKAIGKIVLMPE
jgi:PKD repeat protein